MDNNRSLRVGIWCAVSSKPQATEDKASLLDQEAEGRRFAESVGQVVAVYRIPGHSRTMWRWSDAEQQMPAYRELREDAEAGNLDVLWCLESSRLGRDAALAQQVVSLLEANGAELYRANAPHVLGQKSTGHRMLDAFGSVMAQQENELKKHRHRSGMRARAKRGLFTPRPPFGYTLVKDNQGKTVYFDQDENAEAVRLITRLYLEGHSLTQIRRMMDESGYHAPRGRYWVRSTVADIMQNDGYAGYPAWGGAEYEGDEPSPFYEPIWSAETFAAIIQERERRYTGPYTRTGAGILTGVAYCAQCGYRMTRCGYHASETIPNRRVYLRCGRAAQGYLPDDPRHCGNRLHVRESAALEALTNYVKALASNNTIDRVMAEMKQQQRGDESQEELAHLRTRIADLDTQRERLALAYAAGDMDPVYYRKADDTLAAQQAEAQHRATDLERYLSTMPDLDAQRDQLTWLFEHFDQLLEDTPPAQVAKALQDAQFRIMVDGHQISVEWAE